MSTDYDFRSWWRPGMTGLATAYENGRVKGNLSLTLKEGSRTVGTEDIELHLAGPADVDGLDKKAVRKMSPPPGTGDAQPEHAVYVELAAEDLAWRHSPLVNPSTSSSTALAPWLVLVVGPDEPGELEIKGDKLVMGQAVREAHRIVKSNQIDPNTGKLKSGWTVAKAVGELTRWAHVHETGTGPVCRILSPARPPARSAVIAALVPAWIDVSGTLTPSWTDAEQLGPLPVYHSWRFRTGEDGDFRTLASRLKAVEAPAAAQGLPVRFDHVAQPTTPSADPIPPADLLARGAVVDVSSSDDPLDSAVTDGMQALIADLSDTDGRLAPVPPRYGDRLVEDVMQTTWGAELNTDPRHRLAAGIGSHVAVLEQELLVDAVLEQLGDVDAVAQTVTRAAAGLEAARRLWNKRFPDDTDPLGRLQLFGPALRRVHTADGAVAELLTTYEKGRPLSKALFSTAARRALRPGTPRVRHAQAGAAAPDAVFREANRCPKKSSPDDAGRVCLDQFIRTAPLTVDPAATFEHPEKQAQKSLKLRKKLDELWARMRQANPRLPEISVSQLTLAQVEKALELLRTGRPDIVVEMLRKWLRDDNRVGDPLDYYAEPVFRPTERPPCRPVDLDRVAQDLADAFDPTKPNAWIRERALGRVDGVVDEGPFEVCTSLDIPAWRLLRDHAPDWLVPGGRDLPDDSVVLMKSNAAFVQALLAGLNHRLVAELRWRGLPMQRGCTPVRRFWDQVDPSTLAPLDDIQGLRNWSDTRQLGHADHAPAGLVGDAAVLAFKSELFRRFPDTLVYAVDARPSPSADPDFRESAAPDVGDATVTKKWPVFQGSLGPDLVFFGFPLSVAEARSHWLVVEQAPIGLRFYNALEDGPLNLSASAIPDDGAGYAKEAVVQRMRVLLRGDRMVKES